MYVHTYIHIILTRRSCHEEERARIHHGRGTDQLPRYRACLLFVPRAPSRCASSCVWSCVGRYVFFRTALRYIIERARSLGERTVCGMRLALHSRAHPVARVSLHILIHTCSSSWACGARESTPRHVETPPGNEWSSSLRRYGAR